MNAIVAFIPAQLNVDVIPPSITTSTGTPIARDYVERDPYEGEYVVTPSDQVQTLETKNLWMTGNVVVGAIPQNYGQITWDGSIITVS